MEQYCALVSVLHKSPLLVNRQDHRDPLHSTYQRKVVKSVLSSIPQPSVQSNLSKQLPASPQSEAVNTVVGQKPQRPLRVSTRQLYPVLAVLNFSGLPVRYPHVESSVEMARCWSNVLFWLNDSDNVGLAVTAGATMRGIRLPKAVCKHSSSSQKRQSRVCMAGLV